MLRRLMEETVDGDYQAFKSKGGAYTREHFFGKYPETKALVADMTDEEIWQLQRGGHDPHKVYAAFDRAVNTDGQPTVLLDQDRQGLRHGRGRRGPEHHPPAEEDGRRPAPRLPRPLQGPGRGQGSGQGALRRARQRAEGLHPEAPRGARRRLPAAQARRRAEARDPGPLDLRRAAEGHRRPRDLDDHVLRAGAERALPRQEDRQVRGADRAGREPHLRHGGHVPPARHLQPQGPALHARGRRPAQLLQGVEVRPGAAGGHQRGRRHGRLDRRRHQLLGARRADDPLLHLLLDVRLPAHRRPRLGGRRQPRARLHARGHRRADHAERRGPAAPGRPQPDPRRHHPELHLLRPDLRLRDRGDRAGRPAAHVRRSGGRLLLPHRRERELPPPGDARGRRGRDRQGPLPLLADRRGRARRTST